MHLSEDCASSIIVRQFYTDDLINVSRFIFKNLSERYNSETYLEIHKAWPEGFLMMTFKRMEVQEIIGVIAATLPQPMRVRILLLAISSDFRRQGFGSILLKNVLNRAKMREVREAILEVKVGSEALSFYMHHGFKYVHTLMAFYQDGSDALLLSRRFN